MRFAHGPLEDKIVLDSGTRGRLQAQHLWTSLEEQLKRYEKDLATKYDIATVGLEDEVFLRECIKVVRDMLLGLRDSGFVDHNDIVVDGSRNW